MMVHHQCLASPPSLIQFSPVHILAGAPTSPRGRWHFQSVVRVKEDQLAWRCRRQRVGDPFGPIALALNPSSAPWPLRNNGLAIKDSLATKKPETSNVP